jgi:hypothetical protein
MTVECANRFQQLDRHEGEGMCRVVGGLMLVADVMQWSKQSCRRRTFRSNPEILNIVKIALAKSINEV